MILTHGANSLQHGFTPKPIPTGFTRVYGVKSAYRNTAFTLDISSLGLTNQDLESVMECYITPFECKPFGQTPYSTNTLCPWSINSKIEFYSYSGSNYYRVYQHNGGSNRETTFTTTDISFGGRKTIICKNNLMTVNGDTWTLDSRCYGVASVTSLFLWGPFDNAIYTPITIYEVTVKKGDTIYAHLVPVRDESTGYPNFFDEVSGRVMSPEPGLTWEEFEIILGVTIGSRMYPTVTIGNLVWLAENLDYKFDGLAIGPSGAPSIPAAWYFNNDETTYGIDGTHKCGLLYNWYAAKYLDENKSTLLPAGWRVPVSADFRALVTNIGGRQEGSKIRSNDIPWATSWQGTNDTGLSALPCGIASRDDGDNAFYGLGQYNRLWTPTDRSGGDRQMMVITDNDVSYESLSSATQGVTIRLVKDAP